MADDLSVASDGDNPVIRIPIQKPTPSARGKTFGRRAGQRLSRVFFR